MGGFQILEDGNGIKNHFAARSGASLFLRGPHFRERVSRRINHVFGLKPRQTSAKKLMVRDKTPDSDLWVLRQKKNSAHAAVPGSTSAPRTVALKSVRPEPVEGRERTMCWPHQSMVCQE